MKTNKYKIGISTTIDYSVAIETQFELFEKFGFDFVSFSADLRHNHFFEIEKFGQLLVLLKEHNLFPESIHIPFCPPYDIAALDLRERQAALGLVDRFLEQTAAYGTPIAILHPHYYFSDEKEACLERAVGSLEQILTIKPDNIIIALENLPTPPGAWICRRLMEIFGPDQFGFCYDSSHDNMSGPPFSLLEQLYPRLTTCHLSDNFGQSDEHLPPGDGNIDWKKLRAFFDRVPKLRNILFEVGTGRPLEEPIEKFLHRTINKAKDIFG